jgi:putative hydrolase of the HAD superfamily
MERTQKIKNIIFDLGGVLLNLDSNKTIEAFARLGWKEADWKALSQGGYMLFKSLETGLDEPDQFREKIREMLPGYPSDLEIDAAWNAMLIDFSPEVIDYLEKLKEEYSIYLLSNTNAIHLTRFREIFCNAFGYELDSLFVKTYYSHEIGFRKPVPEAFHTVLQDASLDPGKTLFVDDMKINTEAASLLGMNILHCEPGTLINCLPGYLDNC